MSWATGFLVLMGVLTLSGCAMERSYSHILQFSRESRSTRSRLSLFPVFLDCFLGI
jgi:hypothetical protein